MTVRKKGEDSAGAVVVMVRAVHVSCHISQCEYTSYKYESTCPRIMRNVEAVYQHLATPHGASKLSEKY